MADLSPAQKIVAAFNDQHELCGPFDDDWVEQCLAAALRAAADQVVPVDGWIGRHPKAAETYQEIRAELLTLATELENHQ